MVSKVWNNLLKFMFLRWSNQLAEALHSVYALFIRGLRKLHRRVIRFSWLRQAINRLLPCPQIVERYIDPDLGVEGFFSILNGRGVRYTVLRWFEDFPHLSDGYDVDLLVDDDDLPKIRDLFVTLPTSIHCDVYSVSPLRGASYRKGVPLYPSHLARQILDTSVLYKDTYRVPDPNRYFFSLAYHAVYHWAEESGLPETKDKPRAAVDGRRPYSYSEKLVALAGSCGIDVSPDLQSLQQLLAECGWSPRIDVLRRIAKGSRWLTALVRQTSTGKPLTAETIRYPLNIHGVRVLIESDCSLFMEYLQRDFCFFHETGGSSIEPQIRMSFWCKDPPWKEVRAHTVPLFKTASSNVYQQGLNRYVDHEGEVLSIINLKRDEGTVYSLDPDAMYRVAYSIIMTRLGVQLDKAGHHRTHALGISVEGAAFIFLADGGCGKTTLGLEMMKHPQVGWLSDDMVLVDSTGNALALPTAPRIIKGSVVPWLPPSVALLKAPLPVAPEKVQIPSWSILSRVCASATIGGLFLCRRNPGIGPFLEPAGFFAAFVTICKSGFRGRDFAERAAYYVQFSPMFVYKMARVYFSRVRTFMQLARRVPAFRFEMGGGISENAALVLNAAAVKNRTKADGMVTRLGDISVVSVAKLEDRRADP